MCTGKTAIFNGPKKDFDVVEYPTTSPTKGNVLLSLERSGICGTDVHIHTGRLAMPDQKMIIGHEFIGKIEELGESASKDGLGEELSIGDFCIACVAIPCKECFNCKKGETASCLNFGVTYVADPSVEPHFTGGFGEFLYSPSENLIKIPKGLSLDGLAAFPCAGPTVIRACEYGRHPEKDELVVVQGSGPMGLFATAWAAKKGAHVVVIGSSSNPERLKLAKELGAKLTLDYRTSSEEERLKIITDLAEELNRGNGADLVIETSGSPIAVPEGINLLRTRGCYLVPGQYSSSGKIELNPEVITFKALQIIGSGQYTLQDIKTYLDFIKNNIDLSETFASCISNKYKIKDVNEAIANATAGNSIKSVFVK